MHNTPVSTRALLAELAELEDSARRVSVYVAGPDGGLRLNPELGAILTRELDVIRALREQRRRLAARTRRLAPIA